MRYRIWKPAKYEVSACPGPHPEGVPRRDRHGVRGAPGLLGGCGTAGWSAQRPWPKKCPAYGHGPLSRLAASPRQKTVLRVVAKSKADHPTTILARDTGERHRLSTLPRSWSVVDTCQRQQRLGQVRDLVAHLSVGTRHGQDRHHRHHKHRVQPVLHPTGGARVGLHLLIGSHPQYHALGKWNAAKCTTQRK